MGRIEDNCEICDKPIGDYLTECPFQDDGGGCECDDCTSRCWGGMQCTSEAVDWREKTIALEEKVAELEDYIEELEQRNNACA